MATATKRPARKVKPAATQKPVQQSIDPQENESPFAEYVVFEIYDADGHEFVATDARMLAIVPAKGKRLEKNLLIPAKVIRKARAFARKETEIRLRPAEKAGRISIGCGETQVETATVEGRFPNYKTVLKEHADKKPAATVSISARLIHRVASHAVKAFGEDLSFDISVGASSDDAVVIRARQDRNDVATYLLMPLVRDRP